MIDLECPYCKTYIKAPDDCYDQDITYEHECPECGKNFQFTIEYTPSYTSNKCACLNGGEHVVWTKGTRYPHILAGKVRWQCNECGTYENRLADKEDMDKHHDSCSAQYDCMYCPLDCEYRKADKFIKKE